MSDGSAAAQALAILQQLAEDNDPDLHATLLEGAAHPAPVVRVYSALLLAERFHDVRALPGLHEALLAWDRPTRDSAADAVWEIGDADAASLIRALHFERGTVRDAIAEALDLVGWFPDATEAEVTYRIATRGWQELVALGEEAVPGLVAALSDPDGNVRRGAVWALGHIGDPRSVPFLVEMLADTSGDLFGEGARVCDVAAEALARIGTPAALAALDAYDASP